jgi:alpha-L-rhamnosidase
VLAPEITPYPKLLQYQTYDVTDLMKSGENAWGAVVADGWWIGRLGFLSDSCQYGDRLAFLAQLELEFDDESRAVVATDDSFTSHTGAYVWSDLFVGEKQDARLEPVGWSRPGFDASGWTPVRVVHGTFDNLEGQATDGVVALETLPVREVLRTPHGETVLDFGQAISGRVRLRVRGEAGDAVALTHSETLDRDGNFMRNMLGRSKDQRDVFVLRGDTSPEAFESDFTYHGFRFVLVEGLRGDAVPADFTAVVLGSRLSVTGSFHCDDADVDRLSRNIYRSQQGNLLSIPTDCPTREKSGFTGDAQVFAATGCFNMDLEGFLAHWLRQVRLEQSPEGIVPNLVPNFPDDDGNLAPDGVLKMSAAWGDAIAIVPWVLYEQYGDPGHLADNYAAMKTWVDFADSQAPDGVWSTGEHFGDWMIPSLNTMEGGLQKSVAETSAPIATSYLAQSAGCVARAAAVLGRETDARVYEALQAKVRTAYWKAFGSSSGRLSSHYQGIYVLALQFGMVPDAMRDKVACQLVGLVEAQGNRLDTGFTSVRFLLPVLCATGHEDVARRLLFQTKCPSWLYEVRQGATTIWERWDAIRPDGTRSLHSYNHYTFGCVGEFLYGHVAGLKPLEPGYSRFALEPDVHFGLDRVELVYESLHGRIACGFEKCAGQLAIRATVPPNTTARIRLPGAGIEAIHALAHPGVASVSQRGPCAEVEVVAGTYEFRYPFHQA